MKGEERVREEDNESAELIKVISGMDEELKKLVFDNIVDAFYRENEEKKDYN